jgi:hypothetical protein
MNNTKDIFKEIRRKRKSLYIHKDLEKTLVDELTRSIDKAIIEKLFKLNGKVNIDDTI